MADTLHCPKCGSVSTDAEFCSECGAAMTTAAPQADSSGVAPAAERVPGAPELCPICGEARPGPFARYCDNCRFDFLSKTPFSATPTAPLPVAASAPAPEPPPAATPAVAPLAAATLPAARWDLHASVDLSLRRADDPMPTDRRERVFPLDMADHLIGRRSDSADTHPEIVINDPGISRRHARILRAPDGALTLVDLGSMNGTRLNDQPVEPNVVTVLSAGDQITLGCWTRLIVAPR